MAISVCTLAEGMVVPIVEKETCTVTSQKSNHIPQIVSAFTHTSSAP